MEWLAEIAKEYGLFVALVAYILWDSRNREGRYITIIDRLSESFKGIEKDVQDIKKKIWG